MSSLVYNNNNNNNNNLKIEMTGTAAAHLFPVVGINSAAKMYRYQNIVPAPTVATTAQAAATTTTPTTLAASGCGKVRKYTSRSAAISTVTNNTNNISISSNTNASLSASSAPYNIDQSQSVQRRNARERNRVKQVNNSFARLRQHIPQSIIADLTKGGGRGPQKKISKVDTLRIAVEYIRRLQDLVEDLNGNAAATGNNGATTNNVASFSAAAAALLPTTTATATNTLNTSNSNNLTTTTTHFYNNNNLASTPPPITSTSPLPLMLSNNSSPLHNVNSANITIAISALQQQQQLTRQQYPNHPLTPISLNAYSPPPPPAALSTQTQLDQHVACHSPTSSFNSSMSFDSGTFEAAPQQLSPLSANTTQQHQQQHQHLHTHTHSHTQASLPTSVLELPLSQHIVINQAQLNEHHAHLQLKFEPHEHFNLDEEDCTPDDEEILDYISLWQEQ